MFGFGTTEIILVIATLVLFFGARKVSNLAREMGEAIKYIRKSFSDDKKDR
jgi:sec-independent protein translocase protein TatA